MADALKTMIGGLTRKLEAFADGNFALDTQAESSYAGDYRPLPDFLRKMRDTPGDTLRHINAAAEQVPAVPGQISGGAQTPAQVWTRGTGTLTEARRNLMCLTRAASPAGTG